MSVKENPYTISLATFWFTVVSLGVVWLLSELLPVVNIIHGGISESLWFQDRRPMGYLVNKVFYRFVDYPQFFILLIIGWLVLVSLELVFKRYSVHAYPKYLLAFVTMIGFLTLVSVAMLISGPMLVKID